MGAIWYRARAELRSRWRAWFALAIILGVFAGVAMTAAAGARRTGDAYPRFLDDSKALDVFIGDFSIFNPVFWKVDFEALEALPYVEAGAMVTVIFLEDAELFGSTDPRLGTEVNLRTIVEGRAPRNANEALLPFSPRSLEHLGIGDTLTVSMPVSERESEEVKLTIVGRSVSPGDLPPTDILGDMVIPHPDFLERYQDRAPSTRGMMLRFERGAADMPRFRDDLQRLAQGKAVSPFSQHDYSQNVQRSFDVQALGLWAVAGLVGVVGLLLVAQTLSRQVLLEDDDAGVLRAIGMTRGMSVAALGARALLLGVVGASVATAIAIAASPLFPRGQARIIEPEPGVKVDLLVIGVGALATLVLALLLTLPVALVAAKLRGATGGSRRSSILARALARIGAGPTAVAGARLAVERGSGRSAVPVRSSISAVTIGVAALISIFTFGASLDRLLATPALYGESWDHVYGFNGHADAAASLEVITDDPDIAGAATASSGVSVLVGSEALEAISIDKVVGEVFLPPEQGRLPQTDEVYLGPRTAEALHVGVGDRVTLRIQGAGSTEVRVSGVGILPPVSEASQFGEGVLIHDSTLLCLASAASGGAPQGPGCKIDDSLAASDLLVNFREGVPTRTAVERVRSELVNPSRDQELFVTRGVDLINFGRLDDIPVILASLVVLVAIGALMHVLITSIRRRRRDLAILRTLGFRRGQTSIVVAWQATTIAVIALLLGIPAGIVVGRALWIALADQIGVVASPAIHRTSILLAIPGALLAANLIALLPARAAARVQPATALRAE